MSKSFAGGAYANQRLNFVVNGKAHGRKAKASNRTREIRPSGIIGGRRETSPGWNCEPALPSKEQKRKPSTYSGVRLTSIPTSALDVHTRLRMEQEILRLSSSSRATVVFVTHDLEEAISLSDEIFLLSASPRTRVVGKYPVDLPKPRNLIDIKSDSAFYDLYQSIWQDLRKEVLKEDVTAHS